MRAAAQTKSAPPGVGEAKSMIRSILPECPRADKVPKELPTILLGRAFLGRPTVSAIWLCALFLGEGDRAEFVGIGRLT